MKYQRTDENYVIMDFERQKPEEILLAIARHSYETAQPRGLGCSQPHETPASEVNFRQFVRSQAETAV